MAEYTLSAKVSANISDLKSKFSEAEKATTSLQKKIDSIDSGSGFKNLGSGLDNFGSKLESIGGGISAFSDKVSAVGSSMTAAFTAPAVAGITAVVTSFADLEQSIGGIQTLFKDDAQIGIDFASDAWKTAGISANEYMEQVTSFSASLISSLGGDTNKAVGYADRAITDMSDNANKFGTDIENVQNAYQGFAKQNYTMLDNLKLGYGGTKEEMQRLISDASKMTDVQEALGVTVDASSTSFGNIVDAISVMQMSLGVTGTTAKEASTTIWGSFNSMKAAAIDFAAQLGMTDGDVSGTFNNMLTAAQTFAGNVKNVLMNIWDNLPLTEYQKNLALIIVTAGPVLVVLGKIGSTIGGITSGFGALSKAISPMATGFGSMVSSAGGLLPLLTSMLPLIAGIALAAVGVVALVTAFKNLWTSSEEFRNSVMALKDAVTTSFQGIMTALQPAITSIGEVFSAIWNAIVGVFEALLPYLIPILTNLVYLFSDIIVAIVNVVTPIIVIISGIIQALVDVISPIIEGILTIFGAVVEGITRFWSEASGTIVAVFQGISDKANSVATSVKDFFTGAFDGIASWASSVFGGIASTITSAFSGAMSGVKGIINAVINGMNGATGIMNKIPGVDIPKIPNLQRGTDNWAGGLARMNEGGRGELTYLPGGTVVIPHDISMKYAKESGRANGVVSVGGSDNTPLIMSAINKLADRQIVMNVNGRKFATATADDYTTYSNQRDTIINRMNGRL